jgi:dihydrofolate synthase/folylpolyglutamate synthase
VVVDGLQVSDEFLGDFAYSVRQAAHREGVELSFHEAITALAFLGLYESGVEWLVVEVGLGGRLDASNVISRPAATAIVSISFDHQAILGDTIGKIAAEKAGIIKRGSPLVTGALPDEAGAVISAIARDIPHFKYGRDFKLASSLNSSIGFWGKEFVGGRDIRFEFIPSLAGAHQEHNLGVAAAIGLVLGLPQERVKAGIEGVFWPARLEVLELSGLNLVLDCAHNTAGIASFISFLESSGAANIDLTFGVLDTKDWREMVSMLKPYVGCWRLLAPQSERALPLEELAAEIKLSGNEVRVECYGEGYERCLMDIISDRGGDRGFVTGSMYMVGRMRELIGVRERPIWKRVSSVL